MTHPVVLIKNIWNHYRSNIKSLLVAALPLGAAMAIGNIVGIFFPLSYVKMIVPLPALAVTAIYVVVVIIYLLFVILSAITLYLNAGRVFDNQKAQIADPYKKGFSIFLSVLWVSVLRSLITIGGLILLIVPGVIWGLRYMFAEQTVIFEGKRGMNALRRSKEITDGKLFVLFVDLIAIGFVIGGGVLIFSWLVTLIMSILGTLVYAVSGSDTIMYVMDYVTYALILVIRWVVIALPFLAVVALYRDLKENKG